ncbi:uncharacterized protein BDV17DRAFT_21193 [Aspergillus undulatus]|uniref:uncharacterized protein n=1 Tax=Aspergillus undulatus TaxID=1810928 RepID=UPI003CCCD0C7
MHPLIPGLTYKPTPSGRSRLHQLRLCTLLISSLYYPTGLTCSYPCKFSTKPYKRKISPNPIAVLLIERLRTRNRMEGIKGRRKSKHDNCECERSSKRQKRADRPCATASISLSPYVLRSTSEEHPLPSFPSQGPSAIHRTMHHIALAPIGIKSTGKRRQGFQADRT